MILPVFKPLDLCKRHILSSLVCVILFNQKKENNMITNLRALVKTEFPKLAIIQLCTLLS